MLSPANGLPVSPLQVEDLIVLKERLMLQQQHVDVMLAERAVAALANYRDKLQLHAHLHHLNGAGHRAFIPQFLPNFPVLQQVDQSLNEPSDRVKSSRYKTELCRPYEEMGACKYGEKCQFAHGIHELRVLPRHPKYKTELCRTYHTSGFCPYGPRCHFIHNPGDMEMELAAAEQHHLMHTPPPRDHKLLTTGSLPGSPSSSSGSQSPESEKSVFDFNDDALSFAIERYLSIDEDSSAPNTPPSSPNGDRQQETGKPRFYPFGHGTDGPAY